MFGKKKNIIKEYRGSVASSRKQFLRDSEKLSKQGYSPISENWTPGSYGMGSFLVALLLCFVVIGFLIFIYMLIVKPDGTLTVTYALNDHKTSQVSEEKICPECAESVKVAANKCRYCGHQFSQTKA